MELEFDQPPRGLIQMKHSLAAPYTLKEVRILRRQAEHVNRMLKLSKKRAKLNGGLEDMISFTDEDLEGV